MEQKESMYDALMKHGTKYMLIFLQYIIKKIATLNLEFQSEHFCLDKLYFYVTAEHKHILTDFIREEIIAKKNFGNRSLQ